MVSVSVIGVMGGDGGHVFHDVQGRKCGLVHLNVVAHVAIVIVIMVMVAISRVGTPAIDIGSMKRIVQLNRIQT